MDQHRYVEAAENLEQAISLRQSFLGEVHAEFLASIERYVVACNQWGIRCLATGSYAPALELLKKAEAMTEPENVPNFKRRLNVRATVFNNLCCYFRNRGKLSAALQFAEKALKLEERHKESHTSARSHLNCAVLLSVLGRHTEALEHIEKAVAWLYDKERDLSYQTSEIDGIANSQATVGALEETCCMLVAAHYNMWVEYMRLGQTFAGAECLQRAKDLARHKLGLMHPLAEKMQQTFSRAQDKLFKKEVEKMTHPALDGTCALFDPDCDVILHFDVGNHVHPWQHIHLSKCGASKAQDILAGTNQITLRGGKFKPRPPPSPVDRSPKRRSTATHPFRLQELIYGASPRLGSEVSERFWDTHPKMQSSGGYVGSPILTQQVHGVKPMVAVRLPRGCSAKRRGRSADAGTQLGSTANGFTTLFGSTSPFGSTSRSVATPGSQLPPLISSPYSLRPPSDPQDSPKVRATYEYHKRQIQMREAGADLAQVCDLMQSFEPVRLQAINILRERLNQRRGKGLPVPTDSNCIRAATRIQACIRRHQARKHLSEAADLKQSCRPIRMQAINLLKQRLHQQRKGAPKELVLQQETICGGVSAINLFDGEQKHCTQEEPMSNVVFGRSHASELAKTAEAGVAFPTVAGIRSNEASLLPTDQLTPQSHILELPQETDTNINEVACHVALEIEFASEKGLSSQTDTRKRSPSVQASGTALVCSFDLDNAVNPEDSVYLEETDNADKVCAPCTTDTRDMFADDDLQTTYSLSVG